MWANGVKVVELTGGECTTHPDFSAIVEHAANTFHLVAIVSNGFLLGVRPQLIDHVASFDNVSVQVSVDGIQEFHDGFRGKRGAFDAAWSAIHALKERGVIVRVGMSVTSENVDQVEQVFLLAQGAGVDSFAATPVASFGRGAALGMCSEADHAVQAGIAESLGRYIDDPMFKAARLASSQQEELGHRNCGAGWRSFGINGATGEIRSCLYLADSKKFGSVDQLDYAEIFSSPDMALFREAPSPNIHLETCRECYFISECNGCFAKAFRVSETDYPECPWRAKYFPGLRLEAPEPSGVVAFIPLAKVGRRS